MDVLHKPQRNQRGQFLVGQNWAGNRNGRPGGSRNKLAEEFISALTEDFVEHGLESLTTL